MKKSFVFLLVFKIVFFIAQSKMIPSKITFEDGHVIETEIKIFYNFIWTDLLKEESISGKKITILGENGKKTKILTENINKIEFVDLQGKNRTFTKFSGYRNLVELKYDGKIKWIRMFTAHLYDGSTQQSDFLHKENEKISIGLFSKNKRNLKNLIQDRPEIHYMVDNINFDKMKDEELLQILQKYDEY